MMSLKQTSAANSFYNRDSYDATSSPMRGGKLSPNKIDDLVQTALIKDHQLLESSPLADSQNEIHAEHRIFMPTNGFYNNSPKYIVKTV